MTTGKLILLRHGQSQWNASNQFTGWVDVALTEKGEEEARHGGELLREANILPDDCMRLTVCGFPLCAIGA